MTGDSDPILQRRRRAFTLLRELVAVDPAEREAWIAAHCDGDAALGTELRQLLAAAAPRLLDDAADAVAMRLVAADADVNHLAAGTHIGPWTVERLLGHGGMGHVYLATRAGDGYQQRGALKLVKRGMDSHAVLARFRRERQILSRLEHPGIARLLDGGISSDGQPFFVMEYVDGSTLRQWLAALARDVDARIDVFLQICAALAHAHRHLIVHCDIKPENVLIDRDGQARLLDFGIARLLEGEAGDDHTATQARFVSRAYAAPEQLAGERATTATDVFQLGVLLFELLTDARFDPSRAGGSVSGWLVRARQSATAGRAQPIPPARLRGDAGIIVARATDPEPQRRYATVATLAADVAAWRAGHPITARADSRGYRLRRFIGRHRLASVAALLAIVAVVGGSALALWQAHRAAAEARLALAAQDFLSSVFEASAPDTAAGAQVTARELLDRGSERIATELADQPRLRGQMQLTLGTLYAQLGQYTQAEQLLAAAHATLAQQGAVEAASRASLEHAAVARELDQLDAAEADIAAVPPATGPALRSRALVERAQLREKQGRFDEALADATAAAQVDAERGAVARADLARDQQVAALMLTRLARHDEAQATFERALATARAVHGDGDTRVALMLNDYGGALHAKGRSAEAEAVLREALAIRRQRLGNDHAAVAETEQILGATLRAQGRFDAARDALTDALRIQRSVFGPRHPLVANTLNSLGMLAFSQRRPAQGEPAFREAVDIYRALGQADTPPAATASNNLATILLQLGRYDEAEPLALHALQVHLAAVGPTHPIVMSDLNSLAQLELRRNRLDAAVDYARRALAIATSAASPPREGAYVRIATATVLNRAGHADEGLAQADAAIATLTALAADEPRLPMARAARAQALLDLGRLDEAQALATRELAGYDPSRAGNLADLVNAHVLLARIADARRQPGPASHERTAARALAARLPHADPFLLAEIERH